MPRQRTNTEPLPIFAKKIKEYRQKAGLSQLTMAYDSGLSLTTITQLEQGISKDPRVSTLQAVARVLGVSVDALLGEKPEGRK